jgi:predicted metalloendopeptidase
VAHLDEIGVPTLYKVSVGQDERMATRYAVAIDQAELSMPDRDYYLEPQLAATKASYRRHVATMLGLAKLAHASALAGRVAAFETALARIEWTQLAARDRLKRYNRVAIAALPSLTPGYDLCAGLAQAGIADKVDAVIVHEPSYLAGLAALISRTDLATLRAYFEWRLLHAYAGYLSTPFVEDDFLLQAALNGTKENAPRWMRAVDAVQDALGDALGKLYAEKYFPAERKARVQGMVDIMLAAYRQSIGELDWMGPQTKKEAQAKLALITFKIGYPETWRDYAALVIRPDDLVGNMMRAASFEFRRKAAKLGKPVDRSEWLWPAQRIDADYRPTMNDITLFAGILQPPFFQDDADDAVNYGAIGAIIGHEISHAFDDKGSQSDGFGNLRDWWTPGDKRRFAAKTAMLVAHYDGYSPLPGYHVNGTLTLPENIADNSGLTIAFNAYHLSLAGQPAPVIDGLSGDQRFYIGFARVWRGKIRDARQIDLIKTDPHAPTEFRANGTLRNQAGFYDAFGVAPGDGMYLAPEQRVKIW